MSKLPAAISWLWPYSQAALLDIVWLPSQRRDHVRVRAQLKPLNPGLAPWVVLDKLAAIQMLDVHFSTTNGRTLILRRYTKPNAEQKLLVKQLKLHLPSQAPPHITAPATWQP